MKTLKIIDVNQNRFYVISGILDAGEGVNLEYNFHSLLFHIPEILI